MSTVSTEASIQNRGNLKLHDNIRLSIGLLVERSGRSTPEIVTDAVELYTSLVEYCRSERGELVIPAGTSPAYIYFSPTIRSLLEARDVVLSIAKLGPSFVSLPIATFEKIVRIVDLVSKTSRADIVSEAIDVYGTVIAGCNRSSTAALQLCTCTDRPLHIITRFFHRLPMGLDSSIYPKASLEPGITLPDREQFEFQF